MPQPLMDRMEIIRIAGYTEDEKVEIARRHLIDRQFKALVVIVDGNSQHALCVRLTDYVLVEHFINVEWRRYAIAGFHQRRFVLFTDDVHAQLNALIADEYRWTSNQLAHLMLAFATE
jgi:hypothetical protein